ncbi:hypothetical protein JMUB3935_0461 [Leptotrichia trevisanii]|uniref:Outer membrane protein beta-barrel domain-containing protein n=1 Tax=Leptotrichia trevisanii TaxID=109328 RepID=A0A510KIL6_9FUSO|nr:outer membrane beta-barrel protein [Leptotrichia trevisanii]BBM51494.1 hypothetical protein JMUB3935_0461 [Leptotrichia trevisanii]
MKKVFLFGVLISSLSFANSNIIEFRAGVSPSSKFEVSPSKKAKTSYEISTEYRYLLTNNTEIGAGIAYQNHGKLKKFTDIEDTNLKVNVMDTKLYNSIPIYFTTRYNFKNETAVTPYIKANIGYSINVNNKNSSHYETIAKNTGTVLDSGELKKYSAKNGMYYAVGAGIQYKGFVADLSYQVNAAKIEGTRYDGRKDSGNANNRRVTLGFGYQFGF